jgi:hypothetical protein
MDDGSVSIKDQQVLFTGMVQNTMSGRINAGAVTAVVRQKSNGQIVATGSQPLAISDSAAPGQALDYSITVLPPADLDPATLETEISAQGQQP